jgi:hypothetical protein
MRSELTGKDPTLETTAKEHIDLICCWGLGQTLQDETYQDMLMSYIISRLQAWTSNGTPPFIYALTSDLVGLVYNLTSEDAPLRHLLVDAAARFGRVEDFEHFKEDNVYRIEFVKDVLVALPRRRKRTGRKKMKRRWHHRHLRLRRLHHILRVLTSVNRLLPKRPRNRPHSSILGQTWKFGRHDLY